MLGCRYSFPRSMESSTIGSGRDRNLERTASPTTKYRVASIRSRLGRRHPTHIRTAPSRGKTTAAPDPNPGTASPRSAYKPTRESRLVMGSTGLALPRQLTIAFTCRAGCNGVVTRETRMPARSGATLCYSRYTVIAPESQPCKSACAVGARSTNSASIGYHAHNPVCPRR
jgi:hypothetical protein